MTGNGTNTWTYDQRGRMATNVVGATTTTYSINDLGLRVKKAGASTNYYAYDEHGHVLGEYDSSGNPLKETAYIGDLPVGVLSKSGATITMYSLLPDWIGTPHIITNSSGTFAWTWDHLAWGDNAPNQNPGGLGTFVYDWRLPGQVYDAESGLNYNRFRDYNPVLSRYVESDLIGLTGGNYSTYGYANGNPLTRTDPAGLMALRIYSCEVAFSTCLFVTASLGIPDAGCVTAYAQCIKTNLVTIFPGGIFGRNINNTPYPDPPPLPEPSIWQKLFPWLFCVPVLVP